MSTWAELPLKRMFRIVNGSTPDSGEARFWDGDIIWITPDDLGRLQSQDITESRRRLTSAGYRACGATLVPPGSLVLSTRAPIGYVGEAKVTLCTNQGCRALVPSRDGVISRYYYYVISAQADELKSRGRGSTFMELSSSEVGAVLVPVPPASKQRAIADFLDRKTAAIDGLIEKKERLIALLAEKRAALIHQAVTKGLDPNVPMKDSGVPWIGQIPAHWQAKRIKFLCRLESGHTPSRSEPSYWVPEECTIPWVSLNDTKALAASDFISETHTQISPTGMRNSSAHIIEAGAVVFTRDATIGLAAITTRPMAVSQHVIAWVCGPDIDSMYLLRVINAMTQELDRLTFGATLKTIGMADVKNLRTPAPPLEEQLAIAAHVNGQLTKQDAAVQRLRQQIEKLKEYRQSLITSAVTGKLPIPEKEPPS